MSPQSRYNLTAAAGLLMMFAAPVSAQWRLMPEWAVLLMLAVGLALFGYGVTKRDRHGRCPKCAATAMKKTHERGEIDVYTCMKCQHVAPR
jgi:hypothetical protein